MAWYLVKQRELLYVNLTGSYHLSKRRSICYPYIAMLYLHFTDSMLRWAEHVARVVYTDNT
jgi:hypothetical protein